MAVHAESSIQLNTIPAHTSLLGGHFIYKSTAGTQEHPTPPSANVIEIATTPSNPSTWGYNTHIGANGIKLRYNEIDLSTWTNTGLIFYNLGLGNTNNKSIELNSSGLYLYRPLTAGESGPQPTAAQLTATGLNITEGSITLGNNFQVDSEGNLYANNAHLSNADVEGAITATSLTIGGSGSSYNGVAAINISGYSIEITSDSTGVTDATTSTYLYPHLYHNGIEIEYLLSTDITVDNSKTYYTRSGTSPNYTYTVVSNPTGNPSVNQYYEHIVYTDFVWYKDNQTIGTPGDANNYGRYLADYEHSYRVIYDFDEGEVGGGTAIQTREVDPSKYITKISDTGITIHPEVWTNQSSYIQLDGTGMELFNSSGDSIAQYGSTARIGKLNNSRFLINSNSLQAYSGTDSSPYFEVSANGLSWGSNTAATTAEVNAAAQTASNYIATGTTGIMVYDGRNGIQSADSPSSTTSNVFIDSDSFDIRKGTNVLATFGTETSIRTSNGTELAHFGYDLGQAASGTAIAPYYTFGTRVSTSVTDVYDEAQTYDVGDMVLYGNPQVTYICISKTLSPAGAFNRSLWSQLYGAYSHAEGLDNMACGYCSHVEGKASTAMYSYSHAEGNGVIADGIYSHAEGLNTSTSATASHAEGVENIASGYASHAEGHKTVASGTNSHAEGYKSTASGFASHAEGEEVTASGYASHAEGYKTTANVSESHAEGGYTTASGMYAHAEGYYATAEGRASHAQNNETIASKDYQTAIGKYNIADTATSMADQKALIIGNGTSSQRSNALTVDWSGNVWCAGGITATPTAITPTFSQCTSGNYTRCYRIGNIVFLSFNINVTTSTSNYDYIIDLPPAIGGGWATNSSISGVASPSTRWFVTTNGTLCSDGAPTVGWHDGSIVYICQ